MFANCLPVLFASGYTDSDIDRDIINLDMDHFINKPYSAKDIMSKIRLLLDSKQS